jgi:serine/threonine protein kinase
MTSRKVSIKQLLQQKFQSRTSTPIQKKPRYSVDTIPELGTALTSNPDTGCDVFVESGYDKHIVKRIQRKASNPDRAILVRNELECNLMLKHYDKVARLVHHTRDKEYDYFVFDRVQGTDLFSWMEARSFIIHPKVTVSIIIQVAEILMDLHKYGIVHMDIKPENIMYHNGKVTLIDFGSALAVHKDQRVTANVGSIEFAAPEVQGQGRTPYLPQLADVWSLGVTFYAMMYAHFPFPTDTFVNKPYRSYYMLSPTFHHPDIPEVDPKLQFVMQCMLRIQPSTRIKLRTVISYLKEWMRRYNKHTH